MIEIVLSLIIIGVGLWVVNTRVKMDPTIKTLLNVVVIIAVCLWLLRVFGLWSGGPSL